MVLFVFIDMMPLHIALFQAFFQDNSQIKQQQCILAPVMLSLETSSILTLLMANLHKLAIVSLYCSHFPNDELTDKHSCTRSPWDGCVYCFLCVAIIIIFLESMHEAIKLLENVSEE